MRVFPLLLLAACQDYNLQGKGDDAGFDSGDAEDDPEQDEDDVGVCDNLEGETHDVDLNTECDVDEQTGSFTPIVKFHYGTTSFCGPPAVGQIVDSNGSGAIDDEDMPAIVLYQSGKVVALKGDDSGVYWTSAGNMGQDGGFAIGDLDGDGFPEVVAAGVSTVFALDGQTGSVMWTSPTLGRSMDPNGYNYPSISDMNHDGTPEVTIGNVILNGDDGSIRGQGSMGIGAAPYGGVPGSSYGAMSTPADLDGDGREELVTGNAAYEANGDLVWSNSGLDGLVAVADFDGDGEAEIVKTSGIYVTGMETDGTEVWTNTYSGNLGAPAVDDLDGDGTPDIVFAAQNSLIALDWGGTTKWTARISDQSGAAGPVLFDFEMDGYPEVLYADEDSVMFFNGPDGALKFRSTEHGSYTILETPVVADVDNDDHVEIVLGHCSWNKSLTVYGDADDSWPPGRKIWNQHGYSISNVEDLGAIPTTRVPNWPTYNSFRSGDIGQPPHEWQDLGAEIWDVCDEECDGGKVYLGAWITNAGNLEAPAGIPLTITAGADGPALETQYTTQTIPPGEVGEEMLFELDAEALEDAKPFAHADVAADGSGTVFECNEDNNDYDWSDRVCD